MTKVSRVYFDLDDVLNAFTTHVLSYLCDRRITEADYPREVGFDIYAAYVKLSGNARDIDPEDFWAAIPQSVWEGAPPLYSPVLSEFAECVGRENVFILTSPTRYPSCWAGKCNWLRRYVPQWAFDNVILTQRKELLARPESLLFDDRDKNVRDWRRAGGQAHLIVRPWNTGVLHAGTTNLQALYGWRDFIRGQSYQAV